MKLYPFLFSLLVLFSSCKENKKEPVYTVKEISDKDLSHIISARNGRALFINIWATWCVPCVEEFPDIVRTYEHYKKSDIDFVSLNVDFTKNPDSVVIPFLKKQEADFPVYTVKEKNSEKVINLLNPEWSGAIPVTIIYDESGKQRTFISGAAKYQDFISAVDSVLGK